VNPWKHAKLYGVCNAGIYEVPIYLVPDAEFLDGKVKLLGYAKLSYSRPAIFMSDALKGPGFDIVLLHETLHLCSDLAGVNLSEAQVESLSNFLGQALKSFRLVKRKRCK
jgi:hypothetical protein